MRTHCLAIGRSIFALLMCVGSGPLSAQHMSRPDLGRSVINSIDPSSPESVFIPVQLGPPSPSVIPSPAPLPNQTPPTPFLPNPTASPPPSSPLPTPLSPSSSPNAPPVETFPARVHLPEDGVSHPKRHAARHSGPKHPMRTKRDAERVPADDVETSLPRLPNVFRNCEEPLPWYCNR
jgi:hypothetical protein